MEHNLEQDGQHTMHDYKSAAWLAMCLSLHLICVKAGNLHFMGLKELVAHFGVESMVSVISGIGSICLAAIMGKHYMLRNQLLKQEIKKGEDRSAKAHDDKAERGEDEKTGNNSAGDKD